MWCVHACVRVCVCAGVKVCAHVWVGGCVCVWVGGWVHGWVGFHTLHAYINTGPRAWRPFLGCRASLGHQVSYFTGPVGHHSFRSFYTISHSNKPSFHSLFLAIHPGATVKHNLHLFCFRVVALYSCHLVLICMNLTTSSHGVATSDDGRVFCEAHASQTPIFY